MKPIIAIIILLLSGCNNLLQKDEVKGFIPGTYIRQGEQLYSVFDDTLIIEPYSNNGNYTIHFHSGYQRKQDNILLPKQYKQEEWTGVYDEKNQSINEIKSGKQFFFDPVHQTLKFGADLYNKIQ